MRRLVYTDDALDDLKALAGYISNSAGSVGAAMRYVDRLRAACRHLAELPSQLGRLRPELGEGIRSMPTGNYVLYFTYSDDAVTIVAVLHARRDRRAFSREGA